MFWKVDVLASPCSVTEAPQSDVVSVRLVCVAIGRIVGGGLIELAVERRAADFQAARNFGHLPAVMRDRKADDLSLHFFERPHLTRPRQHRQCSGGMQRGNRYFIT